MDEKEVFTYTPYFETDVKFENEEKLEVYDSDTKKVIPGYGADTADNVRARQAWLSAIQPESMFALKPQKDPNTWVGNLLRSAGRSATEMIAGAGRNIVSYGRGLKSYFRRNSLLSAYLENADTLTDEENESIVKSIGETLNMEDKYLKEVNDELYKQNQRMLKKISDFWGVDEGTISSMLGNGLGTMLSGIAFNWAGGSALTLGMFGATAGAETYAEARQAGLSNFEAIRRGTQMGVFEALSEEIGLQLLFDNIKITNPIQAIAFSILNEGQQEAVQTVGENLIMLDVNNPKLVDFVKDVASSFLIGGFTGGLVGGVGRAIDVKTENRKAEAKQKLMDVGIPENTAQRAVDKLEELSNDKQLKTDIVSEIINKQLDPDKFPNQSYDDLLKHSEKYKERFLTQAQVDFDVKEDIKSRITGLSEEETNFATDIIQSTLESNYEEFGITPREQLEQTGLKIQGIAEDIVNNQQVFNQTAFAGSRVDYDKPSLEAIGSGEGAQSHGYGLYYALNKDIAEGYRRKLANDIKVLYKNKEYNISENFGTVLYRIKKYGKDKTIEFFKNKEQEFREEAKRSQDSDWWNSEADVFKDSINKIKNIVDNEIKIQEGQVHEVDIPENPYLLDEQSNYEGQSDFVKKILNKISEELGIKTKGNIVYGGNSHEINGKYIYSHLIDKLGSPQEASEYLYKNGIKGITYDGKQDGRCFVIFNPDDVKVVQKFYQQEQSPRGQFDMTDSANRLIKIFKEGDRDTLVHELSHHFSIYKIELAINNNKLDSLNPLFKHFDMEANIENARKLMTTEYQEQIATMAVNYFTRETAPTAGLRRYFENLRQWAMDMWDSLVSKGLVSKEELSPDIVEFFDSMFGTKGRDVDLETIKGKEKEIKQLLKDAVAGKKVNIGDYDINQIYNLIKRRDARIPRAPKNLKQALTSYGGIDIDFARNMDLINLMGMQDEKHQRLFRKDGRIKNETELMEFLKSNGFLSGAEIQTYNDLSVKTQQVLDMLENAENTYAEQDIPKIAERENAYQALDEADRILSDLNADDVLQALATIKEQDLTAIDIATAKRLGEKIDQLGTDYQKIIDNLRKQMSKQVKQDNKISMDKSYLQQVVDFINKQNLELKDKAKLLWEVNNVKSYNSLSELLFNIKEKAEEYYNKEQVNILRNGIYRELQETKAKKKEQKYDYENNKLFQELRQLSRITQEQALDMYKSYSILDEEGNPSHKRELVKTFLAYKMNGANSSPQLLQHILSEIRNAKDLGKEAKDYIDFERKFEISQNKEKIVKGIETRKLSGKISGTIAKSLDNLHSILNYVAGLDIANKFQMITVENQMQVKKSKILEAQVKKAKDIYGFKTEGDFLNKISEMRKVIGTISTKGSTNVRLTYDLTKMGIIDLYNTSQNAKSKENLIYFYGAEQLQSIFNMLSDQDIQFADSLRESVGDLYDKTNEVYVKVYQTDLNKLDHYWMQSSVRNQETDLLANYEYISNTPSSLKHRTSEKTLIIPKDAYSKYQSHVSGAIYYQEMALPFKELRDTFNSQKIKNTVENKFGKDVWGYLDKQINELSYGKYMKGMEQDAISSILNKMVNNFVVSKIALAPSVFFKQLTSITNYSENMGFGEWSAGFIEGLSHPKETKAFMEKYVGDYLKERCQSGYDEAIKRVMETAKDGKKTVLSAKAKNNYTSALSFMSRMGDIGAIIYGGYPRLKQMINSGMSIEEASKKFIFETENAQQSGLKSSLSGFQQNRNAFVRLMFSFKNTSTQYARKMNDTIVSYINGDISAKQASRVLFNYGVIQPALYIMAGNLIGMAFGDDRDLTDGFMKQLGMQFVDWIPFVNSFVNDAINKLSGGYTQDGMSMIAYDDLMKAIKAIAKDEKTAYDLFQIVSPFIEGLTGAPAGRLTRNLKPVLED